MRISIQLTPKEEPRYYTKVHWNKNVNVVCADEAGTKMLEEFLSSDIQRLPFNDRQHLYGLLENDGIKL
jgi:hypothetical protein